MDLSASSLIVSLIVSSIGFVAATYGKRQGRVPQMVVGGALLVFPYFVSSVWLMIAIAGMLLMGLWLAVRSGW